MAAPDPESLASLLSAISSSEVIELNAANFSMVVNPRSVAVVAFYMPSPDGRDTAPHKVLDDASKTLAFSGVNLGRIDGSRNTDLCRRCGVQEFPYVPCFKGLSLSSKWLNFEIDRTVEQL